MLFVPAIPTSFFNFIQLFLYLLLLCLQYWSEGHNCYHSSEPKMIYYSYCFFPILYRSLLRSLVLEVLKALVVQLVPLLLVHLVSPVVPLLDRVLLEALTALKLRAFDHVHLFQEDCLYHHGLSIAQELGKWVAMSLVSSVFLISR